MKPGFFELNTPEDLLLKLDEEYEELVKNPCDARSAFNFFVTAEHLPDWLQSKGIKNQLLPKICSDLANGAKHFQLRPGKARAVAGTTKDRYVEEGYVEEGYFADPLIVELEAEATTALGASRIEVLDLASKVHTFWHDYFKKKRTASI